MQAIPAIGGEGGGGQAATPAQDATSAFGVGFEDLLQIVLTQLTYQDPLKPLENFEFVSQLAQFSQIQQSETTNERLLALLQVGTTSQAASLLGQTVDVPAGNAVITGRVTSITFQNGEPRVTIETDDQQTISNISMSSINRLSEGS